MKEKIIITIPKNLYDVKNCSANYISEDILAYPVEIETYTLLDLMSKRDSLTHTINTISDNSGKLVNKKFDEFQNDMLLTKALQFNLALIKESIDIGNGPVKSLIFTRHGIKQRIVTLTIRINNLNKANSVVKDDIKKLNDELSTLYSNVKKIDIELKTFNKAVKVEIPLLSINTDKYEKVVIKKKGNKS